MDERAPTVRRRHWLRVLIMVGALLLIGALVVAIPYRRQIVSYMTHWKGSPTHTEPYVAYDPAPPVHLAAAGDVGDSGRRINATGAAMAQLGRNDAYDALLLLGDNVYPSGDPAGLPTTVYGPFAGVLQQGTDLLAIVGNHDVKKGNAEPQMKALGMPGLWWSRTIGNVLLVGLNSNDPDNPAQLSFLKETLAASRARWKVVALHHPPYSAGYQGSDKHVRAVFTPIFAEYGVPLVLSGHDHDYQRSKPIDGVTYVVSGAAAGTRRTGEAGFTAESFSWHHFLDIAVFTDRLVVRAVNQEGRVADEVTLPAR
jgi:3',5'-cyclic AMP phosphodiesterase CpdA